MIPPSYIVIISCPFMVQLLTLHITETHTSIIFLLQVCCPVNHHVSLPSDWLKSTFCLICKSIRAFLKRNFEKILFHVQTEGRPARALLICEIKHCVPHTNNVVNVLVATTTLHPAINIFFYKWEYNKQKYTGWFF